MNLSLFFDILNRLVAAIGDTYGAALLLHMLTSTICLTLLAYQATKIDGVNVYAFSTIGYLVYSLGQVFHFCIYGNRLIEEVIFSRLFYRCYDSSFYYYCCCLCCQHFDVIKKVQLNLISTTFSIFRFLFACHFL